ncbi:MAG: hypothetical protein DHS20C19_25870 [Acidimicrobiales bacterium]|nr:MAG: hypothetical protein DHS20C19_25870 [Acidimicrobiales bacterium]
MTRRGPGSGRQKILAEERVDKAALPFAGQADHHDAEGLLGETCPSGAEPSDGKLVFESFRESRRLDEQALAR